MASVVVAHAGGVGAALAERIVDSVQADAPASGPFDPARSASSLLHGRPEVLLLGPELDDVSLVSLTEYLDLNHPEVAVVWVREPTPLAWQLALRSGARDVISPDADSRAITETLDRARLRLLSRQQLAKAPAPVARRGAIIVVASPKGGCGKTMVSTNVAVTIAASLPNEVLLIDLDAQFGDVASHLRLNPTYGIHSAAVAQVGSDPRRGAGLSEAGELKAFLTPYEGTLMTLCAPVDPSAAEDVTADSVSSLLRVASEAFKLVVVDTGAGLDDLTLAAIDMADHLVLVSSTEVPSVRAIRTELALLDRMGSTAQRYLVLNRSDAKVGLTLDDIERALEMKFSAKIPSTIEVPESINAGTPVALLRPRSPVTKELAALSRQLLMRSGLETVLPFGAAPQNEPMRDRVRTWKPGKGRQ